MRGAARKAGAEPLRHAPAGLAVIGGGAAGMFAAMTAAERGVPCVVFERKARLGAKVLMTANGRCNFTKDVPFRTMLADIGGEAGKWLEPAFAATPPSLIVKKFRGLGLAARRMRDGRMFPASGQAASVVHAIGDFLREKSVPLCFNAPVTGVQPVKNGFIVATANFTLWAKNVLVATGGVSFPKTGSVGDGQRFAAQLGHAVTPLRAGLTGFEFAGVRGIAPGRREDGFARVVAADGRELFGAAGEVDVETWGLSGAAVYNCQRFLAREGLEGCAVEVRFGGERLRMENPKARPLKEAIVTVGGVALDGVDPETMESKLHKGLYFAGETLDADGPTGGYNLSIAFATGRLAALSCRVA